jgi:hypothetical protein
MASQMLTEEMLHICRYLPEIRNRLSCVWKERHVGRGTELGADRKHFGLAPSMLLDDPLPPL